MNYFEDFAILDRANMAWSCDAKNGKLFFTEPLLQYRRAAGEAENEMQRNIIVEPLQEWLDMIL